MQLFPSHRSDIACPFWQETGIPASDNTEFIGQIDVKRGLVSTGSLVNKTLAETISRVVCNNWQIEERFEILTNKNQQLWNSQENFF